MSTPTQQDFIDVIREELGLVPGDVDWAMLKLVTDRLGVFPSSLVANGEPVIDSPEVAILIGHTPGTGAWSVDGQEEWHWNKPVVRMVIEKLIERGVGAITVQRTKEAYSPAVKHYAKVLNAIPTVRAVVELHFNSAGSPTAGGHEYVYAGQGGRELAICMSASHSSTFPWQRDRGIKRPFHGRGSSLLKSLKAAAVIAEPAFGSNPTEWDRFKGEQEAYATALTEGIAKYLDK